VPVRETASATAQRRAKGPAADGSNGRPGIDWRWSTSSCVLIETGRFVGRTGRKWDRSGPAHDVEISPYDPEQHIWIVDADNHFVTEFTHDGKTRVPDAARPAYSGTDGADAFTLT